MNSKDNNSDDGEEKENDDFYFEVDYGKKTRKSVSKVDPFLLQTILMKTDRKGKESQHQHRKRCEAFFRSLCSRYSNLLDDYDDDVDGDTGRPPKKIVVEEATETNPSNVNNDIVAELAKRLSHLKSSMALDKRESKTFMDGMPNHTPLHIRRATTKPPAGTAGQVDVEMSRKMARSRWQVAIGLVMGMAKMATHSIKKNKGLFSVGDLIFDPSLFKASENCVLLSAESKFILSQAPEKRIQNQIDEVAKNLSDMDIKSFKEYPTWMQRNLLKIGRFEAVTTQRVIIRQGRPSENFYFLLDGTVVVIEKVNIPDKLNDTDDLVILRKGAMFGEVEMINKLNRRATVISKGNVELLTIERDEIVNMLTFRHRVDEPFDHIKFLRRCEFIDSWPMGRLNDNPPGCCMPYFFKQNALIVEDSTESDYLVFIRSGQCRVICKLYKNMFASDGMTELPQQSGKTRLIEYNDELLRQNFRTFSRHGSQFASVFAGDPFEQKLQLNASVSQILEDNRPYPNQNDDQMPLPPGNESRGGHQRLGDRQKQQSSSRVSQRLIRHGSSSRRKTSSKHSVPTIDEIVTLEDYPSKTKLEKALLLPTSQEPLLEGIKEDKENVKTAMYIQLDTLKENDVFGLETLVFDRYYDNPSSKGLCLVSEEGEEGVSAVLLSKSLFTEYASEQVAWKVRQLMKVYPDPERLSDEIERQELWRGDKDRETGETFTGRPLLLRKIPWK